MEPPTLNPARTGRVTRAFLPLGLAVLAACSGEPESVTIGLGDAGSGLAAIRAIQDELGEAPLPFDVRFDQSAPDSDDQTADGAVARALALTSGPDLVTVIGHSGSRGTLSAAPIYSNAGIPMVSPLATSDALAELGSQVFRLVPGNQEQGAFLAEQARALVGATTATVVYVADEYGTGLTAGITQDFEDAGGQILDEIPISEAVSTDLVSIVAQSLQRGRPEVLFLALRSDQAIAVLGEFTRQAGPMYVFAGDAATETARITAGLPSTATEHFYRVHFWHHDVSPSSEHPLIQRFRRVNGIEPSDVMVLYMDALTVTLAALREVGPVPARLTEFYASLGADRPAVQGIAGPIEFTRGFSGNLYLVHILGDSVVARLRD